MDTLYFYNGLQTIFFKQIYKLTVDDAMLWVSLISAINSFIYTELYDCYTTESIRKNESLARS